ncbi:CBS domain-containing protein [Massilibacteroides sp.]|uniref:CBS domain-containing protein n=1 Tax=Massilibacteroides sp. TaxID=2034766 RepID=UPI002619BEFA|nr:CBS domain-containing protein [Massilibacteroides sp.]MDD4516866.1 CBS domain-containing protein [Massilibacteroides sp.]
MLAKDFITKDIPVLKSFDTIEYALTLMDDFKLKHLPIVEENTYQGILSERELLAAPDATALIGAPVLFCPSILENGHLHEALASLTRYHLTLLPVITTEGKYYGCITRESLIDLISELSNAEAAGSVIILEVASQDYSLADISRIIESNKASVLNLFTRCDKDTDRLLVILKIDMEDASPVIRSFERFNYTVLYHFMEKGMVDELLQQRMNELLHYMNL